MYSIRACDEPLHIGNIFKDLKYSRNFSSLHPEYFYPDGLLVFTGAQGSGKTLSAVKYVCNLMNLYPSCKLVSNILIRDYPFDNDRVFLFRNSDDLMQYTNGEKGVIYLIDEVQLYFNSLESKNISMDVMTEISQQRKQRKHIVCTSQVFGRLAKPLREQFNTVVVCRNYFHYLQVNKYVKQEDIEMSNDQMHFKYNRCKRSIFFHSPDDYANYDTYFKIEKSNFNDVKGGNINIYDLVRNDE